MAKSGWVADPECAAGSSHLSGSYGFPLSIACMTTYTPLTLFQSAGYANFTDAFQLSGGNSMNPDFNVSRVQGSLNAYYSLYPGSTGYSISCD
jgi:hypothetical protein